MQNIKDPSGLIKPEFVGSGEYRIEGGGDIHISGEVIINGVQIGEDRYEVDGFVVNGAGEVVGKK